MGPTTTIRSRLRRRAPESSSRTPSTPERAGSSWVWVARRRPTAGSARSRAMYPLPRPAGDRDHRCVRRTYDLRRRGSGLRPPEGRVADTGDAARTPPRTAGAGLSRRVRRRRHCVAASGAAGGLAGGLAAIGATLVDGFALGGRRAGPGRSHARRRSRHHRRGFLDEQSFDGKVVGGVVELAAQLGIPVLAVVGDVFDDADTRVETLALAARFGRERALADTLLCVEQAVSEWLGARRCNG